jgi:hypothetical protein
VGLTLATVALEAGARAAGISRGAAYLRFPDDRRSRQRQGRLDLHGNANISLTLDRYGHLMPGGESEARTLLDAYLGPRGRLSRSHAHSHGTQKVTPSRGFLERCEIHRLTLAPGKTRRQR